MINLSKALVMRDDDRPTSRMDGSVVVEHDTAIVLLESSSLGMGMRDIEGLP